jgi:hypothetical protein
LTTESALKHAAENEWLRARVAELEKERDHWKNLAQFDDVGLDGTDGAHPAWWRGHDQTMADVCQKITAIFDRTDTGAGVCSEPWESVRRRLIERLSELYCLIRARNILLGIRHPYRAKCACTRCIAVERLDEEIGRRKAIAAEQQPE